MKVGLLCLTGFGNAVLQRLKEMPAIEDVLVFTRKETGLFPYYKCEDLATWCKGANIRAHLNLGIQEIREKLEAFNPDIIFVATYDKKIPPEIFSTARMGIINIHPSLLPHYRGPTPTNWAIIQGETESGVTFHLLSEEYDMGDILCQQRISIKGICDGELRQKLAELSGRMVAPFLNKYMSGKLTPRPQRKEEGSYFPKVTSPEGISLLKSGRFNLKDMTRGLTPYPGVGIIE